MKTFNTAGTCRPNQHYMVDITDRLEVIRKMVVMGDYFCINRGRQYGKTTTLAALTNYLKNEYCVFNISFEGLGDSSFVTVENAFVYEYDDKVWGDDRAFFADESLYYPYCDCEDRSILFTRMVRDLIALPCLLVYYPGHLAAAVCFDEKVNGDYIMVGNNRFVVCDPTYINAPIGATMPGMDNQSAKVIVLN